MLLLSLNSAVYKVWRGRGREGGSKKLAQQFDRKQPKIDEFWKRKEFKDGSQQ